MHPCKDSSGAPLWKYGSAMYDLVLENVPLPGCAKPQTVNLLELLENVFSSEEPDTSPLKHVLLALIESGQRHDYHEHGPPEFGKHSCARKGTTEDGKDYVYCRYLYPRRIQQFTPPDYGHVGEDPHRPDLRNLCLTRNDSLINNFEDHLLLMNLGNIDWRALLNLWSILDY